MGINEKEECGMSSRQVMVVVFLLASVLVLAGSITAQMKQRVDLTGRQDLMPEEIISALSPSQAPPLTRGIEQPTRGVMPTLSAIAISVIFAFNSAELSPEVTQNLHSFGIALQSPQLALSHIRIEGHTDSVGSDAYNLELSEKRAQSVKQYLVKNFEIASERLIIEGHGESEPLADNRTLEGRQKNRRVEFVNLGTQ
jgi:outer membrane protein OmpA-like peptidoglycan-associated protein